MKKRSFYLLVLFCVVLFLAFLLLIFNLITSTPRNIPITPTPTNVPPGSSKTEYEMAEPIKGEEISKLIDKTPYKGAYFSFTYEPNEALFYLYIDPANESRGNKEFNEFLKQNGIDDRTLIKDLQITNTKPNL